MKVLYVDLDNTLVDFQSGIDATDPEIIRQFADRCDEVPGIFAAMTPMEGAIEAYTELAGLFDTYILSTAAWNNPSAWQHKLEWVHKYLGSVEGTPAYKRLILSHHKNLNRGDFLVDDRPTKNGVADFQGELVTFGSDEFPDWPTVVAYLRDRA